MKKSILFGALLTLICFSNSSFANNTDDLPVKFIRFYINQASDNVQLRWTTESEYDNDYFTIERSIDMVLWETLETVPGAATSPGAGVYEYFDTEPKTGLSYYRIRQTDFDGDYDFSHIEKLEYEELMDEIADVEVAPNPLPGFGENFTINSEFSLSGATVRLIDIAGKEIKVSVDINDTKMTVTPYQRTPGLYFIIIQKREQSIIKKIKFE